MSHRRLRRVGDALLIAVVALLALVPSGVGAPPDADTEQDDSETNDEAADSSEVAIGERLFLETRFAQFFFANSGGDANAALALGDPTVEFTTTTAGPLPGPFAGTAMNCRSCHLVGEQKGVPGGGNRTYADFARRSPVPPREDGGTLTARNAPPLVNASLPRRNFLLHFDGEFATIEELVLGTLTGRNFGWLPLERAMAAAHIAHVVRHDDGTGPLAAEFGGAYAMLLKGTDPAIPPELRLPRRSRIDVARARDAEILDAVARLVAAYLRSLEFARDAWGAFSGSPYDAFLRKNGLPTKPDRGESTLAYSRRLRDLVDQLRNARFVTPRDGTLELHDQAFAFGPTELEGLKTFLREPIALPLAARTLATGGVGNCIACHPAPVFTDFGFHNNGAAQDEYDALHGPGAFLAVRVPDLHTRRLNFDLYLPPTPAHPHAQGPFLDIPSADRPGRTDLGLWNVVGNPDIPRAQEKIRRLLCDGAGRCSHESLLSKALARFKTPGLRDLGHSAPYLHTGRADTLSAVLGLYAKFSALARAGQMRNAEAALEGIALRPADTTALVAFLRSLNEDYE